MKEQSSHARLYRRLNEWGCDIDQARDRFLEDDALYVKCLHRMGQSTSLAQIREALDRADREAVYEAVHFLKGSASTLGVTPVLEAASRLLDDLEGAKGANLQKDYQSLAACFAGYQRCLAE